MTSLESMTIRKLKAKIFNLERQLEMASAMGAYINFVYDFASDSARFFLNDNENKIFDIIEKDFSEEDFDKKRCSDIEIWELFPYIAMLKEIDWEYNWERISDPICGHYIYHCPIENENGEKTGVCGYLVNEKDQTDAEVWLKFIDNTTSIDPLTRLFTLDKFKRMAENVFLKNRNKKYVVVFSDINNFKYINDTFGFLEGDRLLADYAELLQQFFGGDSIIARHSADKFLVFREYKTTEELKNLLTEMNIKFRTEKLPQLPSAAVSLINGACLVNPNTGGINSAIDNANTARKRLKESKSGGFILYNDYLEKQIYNEMDIITNMQNALDDKEFKVFLQPKVSFKDNELTGAEALVRWIKSDGSMVFPGDFIPVFEKNGFIVNLDFYMLESVCALQRKWLDEGRKMYTISVNMSRFHVLDPLFPAKCKSILDKYGIAPELIELELTEGIFLSDMNAVIEMFVQLKRFGFYISIDDFGSGFSSLNILKDLPADILKIDKGFFSKGRLKDKDKIIVEGVVSLAKNLDMIVLCEGVETEVQVDFLRSINCDIAQGYYFSMPIPLDEFELKYASYITT